MYYNDLYRFDLSTLNWVILDRGSDVVTINEALGRPSPRDYLGFASTDTHLYVFGGWGGTGEQKRTLAPLEFLERVTRDLLQSTSTATLEKVLRFEAAARSRHIALMG